MSDIQQKIQETIQKIASLDIAEKQYLASSKALQELKIQLEESNKSLEKELKDVEKLEKLSMQSLFQQVLGSKDEKLEKERQEYLTAVLKHKELIQSIELYQYEISILEKKLSESTYHKSQLESLKTQRLKEMLTPGNTYNDAVKELWSATDSQTYQLRELQEALQAGRKSFEVANEMLQALKSALQWGQFDMFAGALASIKKSTEIDRANTIGIQLQRTLTVFAKELEDVHYNAEIFQVVATKNNRLMDVFFDNLISDWIIQSRIKHSANVIDALKDNIYRTVLSLNKDIETLEASLAKNKLHLDQLLLSK